MHAASSISLRSPRVAWRTARSRCRSACSRPSRRQPVARAERLPDFTDLVEQGRPGGGQHPHHRARPRAGRGPGGAEMDEDMVEFFRRFGIPMPGRPDPRAARSSADGEPQQRGVGSGFILSADGYVHDQRPRRRRRGRGDRHAGRQARVQGQDRSAPTSAPTSPLVKIEASGLPTVRIGDVSKLKVGEWVIAIGSPFGLESTVTAGIVSAKSRDTGDYCP